MDANNIAGRFKDCRVPHAVYLELCLHLCQDLKWYLKNYKNVIPEAIAQIEVAVKSEFSGSIWDRKEECVITVTTKDGKYKHEKILNEYELNELRNNNTAYNMLLLDLYSDFNFGYYKYEYARQIHEGYDRMAKSIIAMMSGRTGERIRPMFCSCCGARLKEGSNKCDYCEAVFVAD